MLVIAATFNNGANHRTHSNRSKGVILGALILIARCNSPA